MHTRTNRGRNISRLAAPLVTSFRLVSSLSIPVRPLHAYRYTALCAGDHLRLRLARSSQNSPAASPLSHPLSSYSAFDLSGTYGFLLRTSSQLNVRATESRRFLRAGGGKNEECIQLSR